MKYIERQFCNFATCQLTLNKVSVDYVLNICLDFIVMLPKDILQAISNFSSTCQLILPTRTLTV